MPKDSDSPSHSFFQSWAVFFNYWYPIWLFFNKEWKASSDGEVSIFAIFCSGLSYARAKIIFFKKHHWMFLLCSHIFSIFQIVSSAKFLIFVITLKTLSTLVPDTPNIQSSSVCVTSVKRAHSLNFHFFIHKMGIVILLKTDERPHLACRVLSLVATHGCPVTIPPAWLRF